MYTLKQNSILESPVKLSDGNFKTDYEKSVYYKAIDGTKEVARTLSVSILGSDNSSTISTKVSTAIANDLAELNTQE